VAGLRDKPRRLWRLFNSERFICRRFEAEAATHRDRAPLIFMARVDAAFTNGHAPLVLVVEDEFFLRYVTAEYLEDCGFSVLQAANADEAVDLLQSNRNVGAVFSDIQMPGSMNGLGLAHWITETLPDVKVLLTSGQVLPAAAREWTLLAKPYDMAEVERRLRDMTAEN
jgi:CheY-like chemotaxis protein